MNSQENQITVVTCALQANNELRRTAESIYSQQDVGWESIIVTPDQNAKNYSTGEKRHLFCDE
jgi:hypothetical protein